MTGCSCRTYRLTIQILYYTLRYEAAAQAYDYDEGLGIYVGQRPEPGAMTVTVVEDSYLAPDKGVVREALIKVPEAGRYLIGLHCVSKEDQFGIYVKNLTISDEGIKASSPLAPVEQTAVPAGDGALQAAVEFTLPAEAVDGSALAADREIEAVIEGAGSTSVKGLPGQRVSAVVETVQGDNSITVYAVNDGCPGIRAVAEVYTGVVAPAALSGLLFQTSPDMMTVSLSWEPVAEGFEGGFIRPSEVFYQIFKKYYYPNGSGFEWVLVDTTDATSYTYECNDGQEYLTIGVAAANEAANCGTVASVSDIAGTPHPLPMVEDFDDEVYSFLYEPWLVYTPDYDYSGSWNFWLLKEVNDAFKDEPNGYALVGNSRWGNEKGCIGMPRFTTRNCTDVTVTMHVYAGDNAAPMELYGTAYGMEEPVKIGDTVRNTGEPSFVEVVFTLPSELLDRDWVQLYITSYYESYSDLLAINDISVEGVSTGIGTAGDVKVSVRGGDGSITVAGCRGLDVTVSALDGTVIYSGNVAGEHTVSAEKGIYVVSAGGLNTKVAVR